MPNTTSPWSGTAAAASSSAPVTTPLGTSAAVAAAAAAAAAAQSDATSALTQLVNIASDSILSPSEKPSVVQDYSVITTEQAGVDAQADAYTVSRVAYDTAVSALAAYLGTLTGWNTIPGSDVVIVGTTFRSKFADVYTTRQALLNAIYAAAKALADNAQTTANGATTGVNQINSVDYLSNQDKIQLRRDWDAEQQIKTQLDAQASALGVSATAYDNAVAALSTNIISAGGPSDWATRWPDGTTWNNTSIIINLRTWWSSIASNRAALQKAIADKVQANAAYADALARSPNNLIKNGNSEDPNATGVEAAGVTSDPGFTYNGTHAVYVFGPSADAAFAKSADIPCVVGDQFLYQCQGRNYGSGTQTGFLVVRWLDATHTQLVATPYTVVAYLPAPSFSSAWTPVSGAITAPAGACFVRFDVEGMNIVSGGYCAFDALYACRKISAGMIQADAIQTSNYAEVSGNPTAGARMDISGSALKVYRDGLQVGATVFSEYLLGRIVQGFDGSTAGGRIFYRGSIDSTTLGGAPNIGCLTVTRRQWDATLYIVQLDLKLQPTAPADNLDAMRYAKIALYRQSALGTTATLSGGATYYRTLPDRLYMNVGTDSSASNATFCTFDTVSSVPASGVPACLVTLFNAYGGSATNCFYSDTSGANGVDLVNNGTAWPAGITGATGGGAASGGGSAGGACPAPWVKILLASGLLVDAGDLYNGAVLAGVNDATLDPMTGVVSGISIEFEQRVPIILEDGRVTEFSLLHRLAVEDRGWVAVKDLRPGDSIVAQRPSIVKCLGVPALAQVVKFQVDGCHTYFGDDLLSHNMKALP